MLVPKFRYLMIGHLVNALLDYGGDYILYPAVIWKFGLWKGGAIMSCISLTLCWCILKFYDWSKKDWLGIEALKSLKTYDGDSRAGRILSWTMRQSDPVACILLSISHDPFITTAYLRRGHFGGMDKRDWKIFLLSWLICNVWWSLLCFAGVETLSELWHWLFS